MRTATIRLSLEIRNNSKYVRGRKRSIEAIEFRILDEYKAVKVADGEYDLQVPYESDRELDDLIYGLLGDIQMTADDRHCFSESCAQLAGSDRVWP